MRDRPFASRLLLIVGLFLVLVPIAGIIRGSDGHVVHAGGALPGAVVAADPIVGSTSTTVAGVFPGLVTTTSAPATTAPPPASDASASAGGSALSPQSDDQPSATTAAAPARSAPATASPSTSAKKAPATTTKSTTASTAAKAPATTAAPKVATTPAPKPTTPPPPKAPATTTTAAQAAPPANTYSKADVEAIIRSVFPADQADEAVRVATRESHLVPTVRNWCCFGLFQIYFQMNQKTLAAIGVTSAEQLYDPRVNAEAAYVIWQRSGWAPWQ